MKGFMLASFVSLKTTVVLLAVQLLELEKLTAGNQTRNKHGGALTRKGSQKLYISHRARLVVLEASSYGAISDTWSRSAPLSLQKSKSTPCDTFYPIASSRTQKGQVLINVQTECNDLCDLSSNAFCQHGMGSHVRVLSTES